MQGVCGEGVRGVACRLLPAGIGIALSRNTDCSRNEIGGAKGFINNYSGSATAEYNFPFHLYVVLVLPSAHVFCKS